VILTNFGSISWKLGGYFPVPGTPNLLLMALVYSEMKTAKLFERSLSSFWAEIQPHFTLKLKEKPRTPYTHRDFDELRLDFPEIRGYFPVPGTLK